MGSSSLTSKRNRGTEKAKDLRSNELTRTAPEVLIPEAAQS